MTIIGQRQSFRTRSAILTPGVRNDLQRLKGNVALAALDLSHMCPMQPGAFRKDILRQLPL